MKDRIALIAALVFAAAPALAASPVATYPDKPVRIMGQGAGSTADYLSRLLGAKLYEKWGQPFVVDNRAGAGGTIAADMVAKSPPDGYSLIMGHAGPMVSAVALYKDLPYDPVRDFSPITLVSRGVTVLVTHPSLPVNSAKELVAYAKQKPSLTYASAGNGTASHLTGELFNQVTGLKILHVPYKSAGAALIALLGNETQLSFLSPITAHAQLKSGKVKAFAVSSSTRFAGLPEVPSATEAGIPGMEAILWFGVFGPPKMPRPLVAKLNEGIGEILRRPDVADALLLQGAAAAPSTPEQLGEWVKSELAKWTPIIRATGIKAD